MVEIVSVDPEINLLKGLFKEKKENAINANTKYSLRGRRAG